MADGKVDFVTRAMALRDRPVAAFMFAAGAFAVALWLRFALAEDLPPGFPFLTFFPAVILTTFLCGLWPGVAIAIACGLAAWFWFIPPFGSFGLDGASALAMGFYVGIVAVDIALIEGMHRALARLRQEKARSAALAEQQSLLYQELQHRVSNNLQLAGALLQLQGAGLADAQARRALEEASGRLSLLGRIHRRLHSPTGAPLQLEAFLQELCRDVLEASGATRVTCTVTAPASLTLGADKAIPLALIVTELVSNALEHGFGGRSDGTIRVEALWQDQHLAITVADDGHGLPPGFDMADTSSLGLRIVQGMARQLGAEVALSSGGGQPRGTEATLTLPRDALFPALAE